MTILKKNITPERALAEFRVAVEIWLSYMDEEHKQRALAIIHDTIWKGGSDGSQSKH